MSNGFLYFNNEIINCNDIIRIYKCFRTKTDDKRRFDEYGITVVVRNTGYSNEWFGEDKYLRDDRFTTLHKLLCKN